MTSELNLQIINRLSKQERATREDGYRRRNQTNADGWILANPPIVRLGNFTLRAESVDWTPIVQPGTKVRWDEGGGTWEYGVVRTSSFGGTNTTISLISNTDYLVSFDPTTLFYSYSENPAGWPGWFNWAPTITGYSVLPTTTMYRWNARGRTIELAIQEAVNGTSNAGATTYTLPVAAAGVTNGAWGGNARVFNNGAVVLTPGALLIVAGGTTLSAFIDWGFTPFAAVNGKRISVGGVVYEM